MTIDFDAWKLVRGFVGAGPKLHLGWVQERAPYRCRQALCLLGPLDVERIDWPSDWRGFPECRNCERQRLQLERMYAHAFEVWQP